MKNLSIIFASVLMSLLITGTLSAQSLQGKWTGTLKVQNTELRVIFNISQNGDMYSATLDSPDQGAKGIPIDTIWLANDTVNLSSSSMRMEYHGSLNKDGTVMDGEFIQMGTKIPLKLTFDPTKKAEIKRPQTPVAPFPYRVEDVTFENTKDKINLAGTLTLPMEGTTFPAVILISGSGPQDRDEEIFEHRPFKVIADNLTKNGIAVLRFDDRGVGESTGDFKKATSADFANDVMFAIEYLKSRQEIKSFEIGLIGHSEGGLIAPMLAMQSEDVAFMVLMAGPGIPIDELLIQQSAKSSQLGGMDAEFIEMNSRLQTEIYTLIKKNNQADNLPELLTTHLRKSLSEIPEKYKPNTEEEIQSLIDAEVKRLTSEWFRYFISLNPQSYLKQLSCPVLALNGSLDSQVLSKENLNGIEEALQKAGNNDYEIVELTGLNHLFQEAESGAYSEYSQIEQSLSPIFLETMTNWILLKLSD